MIQVIAYDKSTKDIRAVWDPECEVSEAQLTAILAAWPASHEGDVAATVYTKKGGGQDHLHAWREHLAAL